MKSFRSLFAYSHVQNGWPGDILSCTVDNIHYLKAKVSPSQPGVGRYVLLCMGRSCRGLLNYYRTLYLPSRGEKELQSYVCNCVCRLQGLDTWIHAGEASTDKERLWGCGARKSLLQEKFENTDFNHLKHDAVNTKTRKQSSKKSCRKPNRSWIIQIFRNMPLNPTQNYYGHAMGQCLIEP